MAQSATADTRRPPTKRCTKLHAAIKLRVPSVCQGACKLLKRFSSPSNPSWAPRRIYAIEFSWIFCIIKDVACSACAPGFTLCPLNSGEFQWVRTRSAHEVFWRWGVCSGNHRSTQVRQLAGPGSAQGPIRVKDLPAQIRRRRLGGPDRPGHRQWQAAIGARPHHAHGPRQRRASMRPAR